MASCDRKRKTSIITWNTYSIKPFERTVLSRGKGPPFSGHVNNSSILRSLAGCVILRERGRVGERRASSASSASWRGATDTLELLALDGDGGGSMNWICRGGILTRWRPPMQQINTVNRANAVVLDYILCEINSLKGTSQFLHNDVNNSIQIGRTAV